MRGWNLLFALMVSPTELHRSCASRCAVQRFSATVCPPDTAAALPWAAETFSAFLAPPTQPVRRWQRVLVLFTAVRVSDVAAEKYIFCAA